MIRLNALVHLSEYVSADYTQEQLCTAPSLHFGDLLVVLEVRRQSLHVPKNTASDLRESCRVGGRK